MATILEEICLNKRKELSEAKQQRPPQQLYRQVEKIMETDQPLSLAKALEQSPTGIIAEFKRRSPSKGNINASALPTDITPSYEKAGATAVSILTDKKYFGGSLDDLNNSRPLLGIPILRKDFTIDEYQIFEAKAAGANAILLIAACLSKQQCNDLSHTARQLGLDTLLEIHSLQETDHINPHISIVGVNNRNLHIFKTDINTSFELADKLPHNITKISESGLSDPKDIMSLRECGYKGFLMGETFMKTANPAETLGNFIKKLTL